LRQQFTAMTGDEHDPEALRQLERDLSEVGPSWTLAVGPERLLRAERGGTLRCEQAAMTPEGLLEAVKAAEARVTETSPTPSHSGVRSAG